MCSISSRYGNFFHMTPEEAKKELVLRMEDLKKHEMEDFKTSDEYHTLKQIADTQEG